MRDGSLMGSPCIVDCFLDTDALFFWFSALVTDDDVYRFCLIPWVLLFFTRKVRVEVFYVRCLVSASTAGSDRE